MIPSDTGARRIGPIASGRFPNNEGNGNSSWVHTRPAAERNISERPSVMISTSK